MQVGSHVRGGRRGEAQNRKHPHVQIKESFIIPLKAGERWQEVFLIAAA